MKTQLDLDADFQESVLRARERLARDGELTAGKRLADLEPLPEAARQARRHWVDSGEYRASPEALPDHIGILSRRTIVPTMAKLSRFGNFNLLTAEALAVTSIVGGQLVVSTDSPRLRDGARRLGINYRVLG